MSARKYPAHLKRGQSVKIQPLDGGKQYQVSLFDAQGKDIGSKTLDPATLASQAALMLEPTKAAEIRRRTAKQTDAGRENPDYDASLDKLTIERNDPLKRAVLDSKAATKDKAR